MSVQDDFSDERAQPWRHRVAGQVTGQRAAVLVSHGFSSTPQSVRGWAEAFAAAGFDVEVPLLPGHASSVADANLSRWRDWLGELQTVLLDLRRDHDRVVVAGISMGGALLLRLAQLHPDLVDAIILMNPAIAVHRRQAAQIAVLARILPSWSAIAGDLKDPTAHELAYRRTPLQALLSQTRGWRAVRADLGRVSQPVLLMRSAVDHVVPALSSAAVLAGISSTDVTEVVYENSFHVLCLDYDAPAAFAESVRFVQRLS